MSTPKFEVVSTEMLGTGQADIRNVQETSAFPFGEVVGLHDAKLALMLGTMDPAIGGVLLRGEKGSAKTTLARGLASLLGKDTPFVNLPLGATEAAIVGSIDLAAALTDNSVSLSPGLLAKANQGVLYVDEVNLLADHLVDTLLDVAVSGTNRVERDGISHTHPARFFLVGSMNPEEGELRPQFLDRFGLCVDVSASRVVEDRVEAISRRLSFDGRDVEVGPRSPAGEADDESSRQRLRTAVPATITTELLRLCSELAVAFDVEGLRADLVLARTAAAYAGFEGRSTATSADLRRIAPLVLVHRGRTGLFDSATRPAAQVEQMVDEVLSSAQPSVTQTNQAEGATASGEEAGEQPGAPTGDAQQQQNNGQATEVEPTDRGSLPDESAGGAPIDDDSSENHSHNGESFVDASQPNETESDWLNLDPPDATTDITKSGSGESGTQTLVAAGEGFTDTAELRLPPIPPKQNRAAAPATHSNFAVRGRNLRDLPFDPTSTAPVAVTGTVKNLLTRRQQDPSAKLIKNDIEEEQREFVRPRLFIFVVDTSGSMGADQRSDAAVGAIRSLLTDAYQKRSHVAMMTFSSGNVETILSPTRSVEVANLRLRNIKTGGSTPLKLAIDRARSMAQDRRYADRDSSIVLLTDGRATGEPDASEKSLEAARAVAAAGIPGIVLDCESSMPRLGLAKQLADEMHADYVLLRTVSSESVSAALSSAIHGSKGMTP